MKERKGIGRKKIEKAERIASSRTMRRKAGATGSGLRDEPVMATQLEEDVLSSNEDWKAIVS